MHQQSEGIFEDLCIINHRREKIVLWISSDYLCADKVEIEG